MRKMAKRSKIRVFTAPLTILMCALIIFISFNQLYGIKYEGPIVFNSKFQYHTKDPLTNGTKPYLWESSVFKGPNDEVFARQNTIENQYCLGMHIYQDGTNDTYDWATIHIKQPIRGNALERMLGKSVGIWVYPTFPYIYDEIEKDPRNVFGIEINDGEHIIWFVFSNHSDQTYTLRNHRIVIIDTPLNAWSYREINIAEQYIEAGWELPEDISFILITGATKVLEGNFSGYVKEIIVK